MNLPKTTKQQGKWRKLFQPRRRLHDPMLVFNMSIFNFEPGWNRVFSQLRQRDNVWA